MFLQRSAPVLTALDHRQLFLFNDSKDTELTSAFWPAWLFVLASAHHSVDLD